MYRIISCALSAFAVVVTLSTPPAGAAVLVKESFEYTAGTAATNTFNGGIGWDGAWYGVAGNSTNMMVATGLTFGELTVSGNSRGGQSVDSRHHRDFDLTIDGTQDVWVAFLAQDSGANTLNSLMALTIGGSDVVQVGKNDATGSNWALRLYGLSDGINNHTTIQIGDGIALSTLPYFVLGFAYDNGETTVTLEAYTNDDLTSPAASGSWVVPQLMAFDGIRVTRGLNFDEFTVATARTDVIPEPASLALLGLGAALMVRRRSSSR